MCIIYDVCMITDLFIMLYVMLFNVEFICVMCMITDLFIMLYVMLFNVEFICVLSTMCV